MSLDDDLVRRIARLEYRLDNLALPESLSGKEPVTAFDIFGGGERMWAWDATWPLLLTSYGATTVITSTLLPTAFKVTASGGPYVDFDGAADGQLVADAGWQEPTTYNFLVWIWAKADTLATTNKCIVAKWNANSDEGSWFLGWGVTNGKFFFQVTPDGTAASSKLVESSYAETTGVWYFVAGFMQPSNLLRIYVGAAADIELTTDDLAIAVPAGCYDGTASFTMGNNFNAAVAQYFWDGGIGVTGGWFGLPVAGIDDYVQLIFERTKPYYS